MSAITELSKDMNNYYKMFEIYLHDNIIMLTLYSWMMPILILSYEYSNVWHASFFIKKFSLTEEEVTLIQNIRGHKGPTNRQANLSTNPTINQPIGILTTNCRQSN
jgi:hypothetical protein